MPPPTGLWKRPQDGISRVQKVAAVELCFPGAPGCLGRGTWIYMRKKYVGGATRGSRGGGCAQGG